MGRDIHIFVEHFREPNYASIVATGNRHSRWFYVPGVTYKERNHKLFCMLTDTSNCPWDSSSVDHDGVQKCYGYMPIETPRGIPQDVSESVKNMIKYESDEHSHSYFTLKELLEYRGFAQPLKEKTTGCLPLELYLKWRDQGFVGNPPEDTTTDWDSIESGDIEIWQYESCYLDDEIIKDFKTCSIPVYIHFEWAEPYTSLVGSFWSEFVPQLKTIDSDPNNVRIVFYLDN